MKTRWSRRDVWSAWEKASFKGGECEGEERKRTPREPRKKVEKNVERGPGSLRLFMYSLGTCTSVGKEAFSSSGHERGTVIEEEKWPWRARPFPWWPTQRWEGIKFSDRQLGCLKDEGERGEWDKASEGEEGMPSM
jgi:hypothetical protein